MIYDNKKELVSFQFWFYDNLYLHLYLFQLTMMTIQL